MKNEGKSYVQISVVLGILWSSAQNLCAYKIKFNKAKRETKLVLHAKDRLRIKRTISRLDDSGEKIHSTKKDEAQLNCSTRTVQRFLKRNQYKYKKVYFQIPLTI